MVAKLWNDNRSCREFVEKLPEPIGLVPNMYRPVRYPVTRTGTAFPRSSSLTAAVRRHGGCCGGEERDRAGRLTGLKPVARYPQAWVPMDICPITYSLFPFTGQRARATGTTARAIQRVASALQAY